MEDFRSVQEFSFTNGVGRFVYAFSIALACGGGLFILIIYLSFLTWAASGYLYFTELALCVLAELGLLAGLIFCWSRKAFVVKMTLASSSALAILGFVVFASTIARDKGVANPPQMSLGLLLPIVFVFVSATISWLKLSEERTSAAKAAKQ